MQLFPELFAGRQTNQNGEAFLLLRFDLSRSILLLFAKKQRNTDYSFSAKLTAKPAAAMHTHKTIMPLQPKTPTACAIKKFAADANR